MIVGKRYAVINERQKTETKPPLQDLPALYSTYLKGLNWGGFS
jgi:hypothetical protein